MPWKECKRMDALNDRSRRPYRHADKLPYQVERTILGFKKPHPTWGAPTISPGNHASARCGLTSFIVNHPFVRIVGNPAPACGMRRKHFRVRVCDRAAGQGSGLRSVA